jgi:hypothetical protein
MGRVALHLAQVRLDAALGLDFDRDALLREPEVGPVAGGELVLADELPSVFLEDGF